MGRIQNEDIKTSAEIISGGGAASQLPNDDKIYLKALGLNKTLNQAIIDGDFLGGGTSFARSSIFQNSGGSILNGSGGAGDSVYFGSPTVSNTNVGLVEITNDSTDGIKITVKRAGLLTISTNICNNNTLDWVKIKKNGAHFLSNDAAGGLVYNGGGRNDVSTSAFVDYASENDYYQICINNGYVSGHLDKYFVHAGIACSSAGQNTFASAIVTATASVSFNNSTLIFPVVTKDVMGNYNSSNGQFTAPYPGVLEAKVTGICNSGSLNLYLYKNGSYFRDVGTVSASAISSFSIDVPVDAGDYVEFVGQGSNSLVYSAGNYEPSASFNMRLQSVAFKDVGIEIGAVQTSDGSRSSSSFGPLSSNNPTLTFTPNVTGKYKVSVVANASGTAANTNEFRIAATAGSPTSLFRQTAVIDSLTGIFSVNPYWIVSLVANTSYTFEFQCKSSSAGAITLNSGSTNEGIALIAERIG